MLQTIGLTSDNRRRQFLQKLCDFRMHLFCLTDHQGITKIVNQTTAVFTLPGLVGERLLYEITD
jgi:hypothetical protein